MTDTAETPGRLEGMTPCYWGSVNQWECDENDHLNVRFYAQKVNQALAVFLSQIGDAEAVFSALRCQHIRFLSETRVAAPLRVDCAVVHNDRATLRILSLMHDNVSGKLLAAFMSDLDSGVWLAELDKSVNVPKMAQPRGIDVESLPAPPPDPELARAAGFRVVGRGVIAAEECDITGRLLPHVYIGRISDAMPNLWAFLNPPEEQSARNRGALGGAALEQRVTIFEPLRRGSVFVQLSGVRALGSKTQQMAHLLYDERGGLAAAAEAVGVAMDLGARKAVPISEERRRHLEGLLLRT